MIELPASVDDVTLAATVGAWIEENLPAQWRTSSDRSDDVTYHDWFRVLGDAGLSAPTWPREYGGLGLSADQAAVVQDELVKRGVALRDDTLIGIGLAGPTILEWGTEEQKEAHLGRTSHGAVQWCQLFSEPGAGSDLASLSTRADQQPDGSWVVNGQKVWSSYAHYADFGLLMARSNPDAPKHRGITYFLLDMRTPGVEPRPLRQLTGEAEFNEVFLTDVHIPDSARLGEIDGGWAVAITTLMNERSSLSGRPAIGPGVVDELAQRAVETGRWEDAVLRDRILDAFVTEKALQMATVHAFVKAGRGQASAEGSIRKLAHSTFEESLGRLATDIEPVGAAALSAKEERALQLFLHGKKLCIAGGTSEIQRNIIGERLLGLPRDRDPQVDVPFAERRRS